MDAGGVSELDTRSTAGENPCNKPAVTSDRDEHIQEQELDPVLVSALSGRRLISGLLGLNVVLLGFALVAGQTFNPEGLKNHESQAFLLLLMGVSLIWMLWYLLWARNQPGVCPYKDHHAGGIPAALVLMLFAAFSLLLYISRIGYLMSVRECKPAATLISPFIEAPFLGLQTYLLWAHSKDCIHRHKIITRFGLMMILSSDLLLWLNAVTEDTIHEEIELEKQGRLKFGYANKPEAGNLSLCQCNASTVCCAFRKAFEILFPFNIECYLMAGCMIYVMWKNVGHRISPGHGHDVTYKLTLGVICRDRITFGLGIGSLVLAAGMSVFILYQVWVNQQERRLTAFLIFYGYHLVVIPVMSLCSLVGMLIHMLERRAYEGGPNHTRSLDVVLLVVTAMGQLALSYFSLVAALAVDTHGLLGGLDLSYSLLSLLELILQNTFIIKGLHRHPTLYAKKKTNKWSNIFKAGKKEPVQEERKTDVSLLEGETSAPPGGPEHDGKKVWTKRVTQEICGFLILSNIMLWVIPAFGVHPQFENGLGKQFLGFRAWFVLVNLGQPLAVFYRMHSVGALMELVISA
ncbi:proton channel OTOP3-like [Pholidichthys leucotaenia]